MTVLLAIWIGVGAGIAALAKKYLGSSWRRAIGGGFIWPTYGFLILGSRIRYGRRRRSLP
jgi:hypothetical protein